MTTRLEILGRRGGFAVEWPTIALLIATYCAFGLLTWYANLLPWWALLPLGGYVKMLGQDDNPTNAAQEAERIKVKSEDARKQALADGTAAEGLTPAL